MSEEPEATYHVPQDRHPGYPLIYSIGSNHGERFKAEARTPGGRVYLGTHDTRPQAAEAVESFLATGQKPAAMKRGPRGPQQKARAAKPRQVPPPAPEKPMADRVAMMRELYQRKFTH